MDPYEIRLDLPSFQGWRKLCAQGMSTCVRASQWALLVVENKNDEDFLKTMS